VVDEELSSGLDTIPEVVTFDRPFIYSLLHRDSGEVVLAGVLRDPQSLPPTI
jgi:hypothetical protein